MADAYDDLRRALADLPKVERWFVVGAPWGKGDFIVAGHPDPHMGRYVADTEDFDGEGENVLEHAAFIAAANPATISRMLQERDALTAAVRHAQAELAQVSEHHASLPAEAASALSNATSALRRALASLA